MTIKFKEAVKQCASFGYTMKRSGANDREVVVYLRGTNADHPAAYFTEDLQDAVDTARVEHGRAMVRDGLGSKTV